MTYWIFVTDHMNWDIILKEGIYGLPEKREKLMKILRHKRSLSISLIKLTYNIVLALFIKKGSYILATSDISSMSTSPFPFTSIHFIIAYELNNGFLDSQSSAALVPYLCVPITYMASPLIRISA